jgi:hypothetical protein
VPLSQSSIAYFDKTKILCSHTISGKLRASWNLKQKGLTASRNAHFDASAKQASVRYAPIRILIN